MRIFFLTAFTLTLTLTLSLAKADAPGDWNPYPEHPDQYDEHYPEYPDDGGFEPDEEPAQHDSVTINNNYYIENNTYIEQNFYPQAPAALPPPAYRAYCFATGSDYQWYIFLRITNGATYEVARGRGRWNFFRAKENLYYWGTCPNL